MNNILASVNKVTNSELTECKINIKPEKLTYDALLKKTEEFNAEQGWLTYQSRNYALTNKDKRTKVLKSGGVCSSNEDNSDDGKLLSAELCTKTQTISIRHLYEDTWQMTTFTENPESKDEEDFLCDTITHYATSGLGKLSYQRLWKLTEQGYEPYASYFRGFTQDKNLEDANEKENNHAN